MQEIDKKQARGGTLVELAMAFVLLAVVLGSLGFYMDSYQRFSEEARVQYSLQLGRLSAIPSTTVVDSNGNALMSDDKIRPVLSMYLATSFVERELTEAIGPKGCADPNKNGSIRALIVTVLPAPPTTTAKDLSLNFATSIYTCNVDVSYKIDAHNPPQAIIQQIKAYANKGSWRYRDYVVVYSEKMTKFGALIVPTEVSRYTSATASPSAAPTVSGP